MNVQADCNNGSGTYSKQDSSITLSVEVMTLAECGPDSMYDQYIQYLGNVVTYVLKNGKLYLNLKTDAGNMVFRSVEAKQFNK